MQLSPRRSHTFTTEGMILSHSTFNTLECRTSIILTVRAEGMKPSPLLISPILWQPDHVNNSGRGISNLALKKQLCNGFTESMYTLGLLRTVILELGTQYLGASWSAIQLPTILVGLDETLPTASASS